MSIQNEANWLIAMLSKELWLVQIQNSKNSKRTWIQRCRHLCVCPLIDHGREPIRMRELLGLLYKIPIDNTMTVVVLAFCFGFGYRADLIASYESCHMTPKYRSLMTSINSFPFETSSHVCLFWPRAILRLAFSLSQGSIGCSITIHSLVFSEKKTRLSLLSVCKILFHEWTNDSTVWNISYPFWEDFTMCNGNFAFST